jgi:hypothetical protein
LSWGVRWHVVYAISDAQFEGMMGARVVVIHHSTLNPGCCNRMWKPQDHPLLDAGFGAS